MAVATLGPKCEAGAVAIRGSVDQDTVTRFVRTHGTRLVRLAHLLSVPRPEAVAADSMADILLRLPRRDAHDQLLAAAREVGASGQPPIRDDGRLQGWLDRAEATPYQVDLLALTEATSGRLSARCARRRRSRRRSAAGVVAAGCVLGAAALWPSSQPGNDVGRLPGSGIDYPNDPLGNDSGGGTVRPTLPTLVPLPSGQQRVRATAVAEVVLSGRAAGILHTTESGRDATVVAVGCGSRGHQVTAICVLTVPVGTALAAVGPTALTDVLDLPPGHHVARQSVPSVLRAPTVDGLVGQTLTLDVTSTRVDAMLVTYTDGSQVLARRYQPPGWPVTLFAALNKDVMPAEVAYLGPNGAVLARRSLYTATP